MRVPFFFFFSSCFMAAGHFRVLTFHFIARCVFYVYTHAGRPSFSLFLPVKRVWRGGSSLADCQGPAALYFFRDFSFFFHEI
jgi:hypothetical protein